MSERGDEVRRLLREHPNASVDDLVALLDKPRCDPQLSPADSMAFADANNRMRNRLRREEACEGCEGAGFLEVDGGEARCEECDGNGFDPALLATARLNRS